MAYTTDQRDALQAAIASGALIVETNGRKVTYRSLAQMRSILDEMNQELAGQDNRSILKVTMDFSE